MHSCAQHSPNFSEGPSKSRDRCSIRTRTMRQTPPSHRDDSACRMSKMFNQNCRSEKQALMLEDPMCKMHVSGHANIDELVTQTDPSSPGERSTQWCESDPFSVQSLGFNMCSQLQHDVPSINMNKRQRDQIKQVLQIVCQECDLRHAEVMYPTPRGMIVSTEVTWCASQRECDYHENTAEYIFPTNVGIPGRVIADRKMEWHQDVTSLPEHIFLRKNIATAAGLKGTVAIPYQTSETENGLPELFVIIFYYNMVIDDGVDIEKILQTFASSLVVSIEDFSRAGSGIEACERSFNPLKCADSMKFFAGNITVKRVMPIGGSRLAVGSAGATSGQAVWKVRVDRCRLAPQLRQWCSIKYEENRAGENSAHGVRIGVAQEQASLKWYAGFDEHSFGVDWQGKAWSGGKAVAAHSSDSATQSGGGFQEGDVVSVMVDFSARQPTVKFGVNDVTFPSVYTLSLFNPDKPIFVAVSLLWPGEQATILSQQLSHCNCPSQESL